MSITIQITDHATPEIAWLQALLASPAVSAVIGITEQYINQKRARR